MPVARNISGLRFIFWEYSGFPLCFLFFLNRGPLNVECNVLTQNKVDTLTCWTHPIKNGHEVYTSSAIWFFHLVRRYIINRYCETHMTTIQAFLFRLALFSSMKAQTPRQQSRRQFDFDITGEDSGSDVEAGVPSNRSERGRVIDYLYKR